MNLVPVEVIDKVDKVIMEEFLHELDSITIRNNIFLRMRELLSNELVELGYNSTIINNQIEKIFNKGIRLNGKLIRKVNGEIFEDKRPCND